jgi:hypothetical protein
MPWYGLVVGTLAVWRVTHLLQAEDGPGDVVVRLRSAAGAGFWGRLLDCFYCLSLWTAAPAAALIGRTSAEKLLLWPALSGAAIMLERLTGGDEDRAGALYDEDEPSEEDFDGMLRR